MKAKDILKNGESAVVIFTDGRNLTINESGKSVSGVWRVGKNLQVDKVIVYFRNGQSAKNEIYVGDFEQLIPSQIENLKHRFAVEFTNTEYAGATTENWNTFNDSKRGAASPIRIIR